MNELAIKDLLYRLADDKLVIGHRNSEWCGFGPVLEEDIAFASMAQDELGHSLAYYLLLEGLGEGDTDQLAFNRSVAGFRSCHFVEMPIGDYAFSLMRHFLWDFADNVRITALKSSSYKPLSELAQKISREEKYHILHARTWISELCKGGEESRLRLQSALNEAFPMAFGLFEPTEFNAKLADSGVQLTEEELSSRWLELVTGIVKEIGLKLPTNYDTTPYIGGRKGYHSEHLESLIKEMSEVFVLEPTAKW